jgi:putative transport protein
MIRRVTGFLQRIGEVSPHAEPILVVCITCIIGLLIGNIRIRGIKLGVTGILFSGLLMGHFGATLDPHVMSFLKEFGLALFVFMIGLQMGPGFFNSLKQDGLHLNGMAAAVVTGGALLAFAGGHFILGWSPGVLAGLFSGATTNTPSLGAAQQALSTMESGEALLRESSLAYAVAYPFAVFGIILGLLILRSILRIDLDKETAELNQRVAQGNKPLVRHSIRVENPNLAGVEIRSIPGLGEAGAVVSRIRRQGETTVSLATPDVVVQAGDVLLVVGTDEQVRRAEMGMGRRVEEDLLQAPGNVSSKRVVLTRKELVGKSIADTRVSERFGVTITRVSRQDMILTAIPGLKLQFGDMVNIVGENAALEAAAHHLGNSVRQLNDTSFASIFIGITVGVLFGLYPWTLPGLPAPLRLGLAGGPLLIAILMGRIGRIGPLVIHMPINANTAFRELGIIFFLACVGLGAGGSFVQTALSPTGICWMLYGIVITMLPLLAVGFLTRKLFHTNYVTLCGALAGSLTDPPALAFATKMTKSDLPALSYATVYPLTMLLRILIAQLAILLLA